MGFQRIKYFSYRTALASRNPCKWGRIRRGEGRPAFAGGLSRLSGASFRRYIAAPPPECGIWDLPSATLRLCPRKRDLGRGWVWTFPDTCVIVSDRTNSQPGQSRHTTTQSRRTPNSVALSLCLCTASHLGALEALQSHIVCGR